MYGMTFNFLLAFAVVVLKPDTSISSWGREKALERLSGKQSDSAGEDAAASIVSEDS